MRETSLAAKRSMEPHLTRLQEQLLSMLKNNADRGMTCDELEHRLSQQSPKTIRHQTVSARVRELYLAGWIYRTDRQRKTRSGRFAIVYKARKKKQTIEVCTCDRPTCSRWPCKLLREYRTTHRIVTELAKTHELFQIRSLLDHIESECEILSK